MKIVTYVYMKTYFKLSILKCVTQIGQHSYSLQLLEN